jgi:hypothetical protein
LDPSNIASIGKPQFVKNMDVYLESVQKFFSGKIISLKKYEHLSTPNTIVFLGFPPRWLEASFFDIQSDVFDYITTLGSDTTCSYSPAYPESAKQI